MAATTKSDHYIVISADCHAGASHSTYREYLDPKFHADFDAWRGEYRNPYKDLGDQRRLRNWDNEMRNGAQESDGVVGEVVFPNTVPPFFPSFVLFAQPPRPEDYEHRRAGVHAHNRWLVEWCGEYAARRAGVGQIFLNDVDDAIEDVRWIKENGLRGGILLPNLAPDVKWVKPLYDPYYDPLWQVCQDLDIPINIHSGTGNPDYGKYPISMILYINEVAFYTQRPLMQLILSGVCYRFPRLKFVLTEIGSAWIPEMLKRLDFNMERISGTGETGEIKYSEGLLPPGTATEYFRQNWYMGVSGPGKADIDSRYEVGLDHFMWGSDYPHDEGTHPHTRDHLRRRFHNISDEERRKMLSENAAKLYEFDLSALRPLADKVGPTVQELDTPPEGAEEDILLGMSDDMDAKAL